MVRWMGNAVSDRSCVALIKFLLLLTKENIKFKKKKHIGKGNSIEITEDNPPVFKSAHIS